MVHQRCQSNAFVRFQSPILPVQSESAQFLLENKTLVPQAIIRLPPGELEQFVRTSENLADFLTREGLLPGDFEKFNLKDLTIDDIYDQLPKTTFSLMEWINLLKKILNI